MEQHDPDNEELLRFRAEAAELLRIGETLRETREDTHETTMKDPEAQSSTVSEAAPK